MKRILALLLACIAASATAQVDSVQLFLDKLKSNVTPSFDAVTFESGLGSLQVPEGFGYLNPSQAEYVIKDLWGNPEGAGTMGMLIPKTDSLQVPDWAFIISYDELGFVKDDDAEEIDYDELLTQQQEETETENEERTKAGYETIHLVGWASKPFYDKDKKVLHWAKELKFGDDENHTLNYNIRVLGRKGVVVINAVASMEQLPEVQSKIDPVLTSFSFSDGNRYADFDPSIDEVAAWTIGGLVAGKLLAKAGLFALLLKNIKLIIVALIAAGGGLWKWFRKKTQPPEVRDIADMQGEQKPPLA